MRAFNILIVLDSIIRNNFLKVNIKKPTFPPTLSLTHFLDCPMDRVDPDGAPLWVLLPCISSWPVELVWLRKNLPESEGGIVVLSDLPDINSPSPPAIEAGNGRDDDDEGTLPLLSERIK